MCLHYETSGETGWVSLGETIQGPGIFPLHPIKIVGCLKKTLGRKRVGHSFNGKVIIRC